MFSLVGRILAAILVIGILLVVFEANPSNDIVDAVLDAARFLSGPFDDLFEPDERKLRIALNWGLAAIVYVFLGRLIDRLLLRWR
jgi:hypothetical protein